MARTPDNASHNNQLSTSAEILYTPDSTERATMGKLSFFNSNVTTTREVTVYVVEASGTADTGTTLAKKTIPPEKTWICSEIVREVIKAGMSVQADQDAGTDVNSNLSITVIT